MNDTTKPKISKFKAYELMKGSKGKIFTVTFIKKDGTLRKMNCRLGVKAGLSQDPNKKGMSYNPDEKYLLNVYDVKSKDEKKKNYRMVDLNTVMSLKTSGVEYQVV